MIVDDIRDEYPELARDIWWDEVFPTSLPYTLAAQKFKVDNYEVSTNQRIFYRQEPSSSFHSDAFYREALQCKTLNWKATKRYLSCRRNQGLATLILCANAVQNLTCLICI